MRVAKIFLLITATLFANASAALSCLPPTINGLVPVMPDELTERWATIPGGSGRALVQHDPIYDGPNQIPVVPYERTERWATIPGGSGRALVQHDPIYDGPNQIPVVRDELTERWVAIILGGSGRALVRHGNAPVEPPFSFPWNNTPWPEGCPQSYEWELARFGYPLPGKPGMPPK